MLTHLFIYPTVDAILETLFLEGKNVCPVRNVQFVICLLKSLKRKKLNIYIYIK